MFKPFIILGLSMAFVGCSTTTTQTASNSPASEKQTAEADDKKPKVICQKTHRVGSHFKKLQCWTQEEYAVKQQRDREEVQRLQGSNMAPPTQ